MAKITFTDDEEREIEIASEVRRRAAQKIEADKEAALIARNCRKGEHESFKDGKCIHCGSDEPKPATAKKDFRRSLL